MTSSPFIFSPENSKKISSRFARGFTLIEILVVIAIIAILSSIVVSSLNTAKQKARDVKRIADIKQIEIALAFYLDACSEFPVAVSAGGPLTGAEDNGCPSGTTFGTFLGQIPEDPDGSDYLYADNSADSTTYCLGANLEDNAHPQMVSECTLTGADYTVEP